MAPGDSRKGGEQGRDGAVRDDRAGGVVDQDDVGLVRGEGFEAGADAVLAGGAAGDCWQAVRKAVECGFDRAGVTDRLQQGDMGGEGLGGMADDELSCDRQELLGGLRAEA